MFAYLQTKAFLNINIIPSICFKKLLGLLCTLELNLEFYFFRNINQFLMLYDSMSYFHSYGKILSQILGIHKLHWQAMFVEEGGHKQSNKVVNEGERGFKNHQKVVYGYPSSLHHHHKAHGQLRGIALFSKSVPCPVSKSTKGFKNPKNMSMWFMDSPIWWWFRIQLNSLSCISQRCTAKVSTLFYLII